MRDDALRPATGPARRGVSFRTPGGPTPAQIGTMLWLFVLGVGALATLPLGVARALLLLGYVSLAVLDPLAARRGAAVLRAAAAGADGDPDRFGFW